MANKWKLYVYYLAVTAPTAMMLTDYALSQPTASLMALPMVFAILFWFVVIGHALNLTLYIMDDKK